MESVTWPVKSGMPVGGEDARWAQRDGPHVRAPADDGGGRDGPSLADVPEMATTEAPRSNPPYPIADGP